ncbi:MAG TPA: hypothetical protein VE967_07595, partial [Gemmatimonadaceae bacterium]|nr:hypothetical protein [Gemmatimonadaceae bacterium]
MNFHRLATAVVAVASLAAPALAQKASGPLLLLAPASTRAAALGNAWVAGRDEDVIFYNPAQIIAAARGGFSATFARYGSTTSLGAMSGAYSAGPASFTIGWGAQFADYSTRPEVPYPYSTSLLTTDGTVDAYSAVLMGGAAIVVKGFRVGAAAKYATDRVAEPSNEPGGPLDVRHDAMLVDAGIARAFLGGTLGLSAQNFAGRKSTDGARTIDAPLQGLLGWTTVKQAGPFDVGFYGQVAGRDDWVSPGGGIELGYSWIEGYAITLRGGGRRTA